MMNGLELYAFKIKMRWYVVLMCKFETICIGVTAMQLLGLTFCWFVYFLSTDMIHVYKKWFKLQS